MVSLVIREQVVYLALQEPIVTDTSRQVPKLIPAHEEPAELAVLVVAVVQAKALHHVQMEAVLLVAAAVAAVKLASLAQADMVVVDPLQSTCTSMVQMVDSSKPSQKLVMQGMVAMAVTVARVVMVEAVASEVQEPLSQILKSVGVAMAVMVVTVAKVVAEPMEQKVIASKFL